MRRFWWFLIAVVVLGCARPEPVTAPPGSVIVEEAPPHGTTGVVIHTEQGWETPELKHGPTYYLWSPDREWVAFHLHSGIWAARPDGSEEYRLVPGEAWRELVGWWEGKLVSLEHQDGQVLLGLTRPGQGTQEMMALPVKQRPDDVFVTRHVLYGQWLALFPPEGAPLRVDLASRKISLLESHVPKYGMPHLSPDGWYAIIGGGCEDSLQIYDLQDWRAVHTAADGYQYGAGWSPVENRWVGLAGATGCAADDTRLPATHLTMGDTKGQTRRLTPPEPLKLVSGPFWSADGKQVAVESEYQPATDGRGRDAIKEVWVVTLETGVWRKLARHQFVDVRGWHPSGDYLVVWQVMGAGGWPIGTLPAEGGEITWLIRPAVEEPDPTRLDERVMVVASGYDREAAAYIGRPGATPISVRPGQLPYMDALQIRPPYTSWVEFRRNQPGPSLVVVKRP